MTSRVNYRITIQKIDAATGFEPTVSYVLQIWVILSDGDARSTNCAILAYTRILKELYDLNI